MAWRQEDADDEEDDDEEGDDDFESAAGHKPIEQLPEANRHDLAAKWWDILASYTLAQDARGWSPERIAAFSGRPVEEIRSILSPRPPTRFTTPDQGARYYRRFEQNRPDGESHVRPGWRQRAGGFPRKLLDKRFKPNRMCAGMLAAAINPKLKNIDTVDRNFAFLTRAGRVYRFGFP